MKIIYSFAARLIITLIMLLTLNSSFIFAKNLNTNKWKKQAQTPSQTVKIKKDEVLVKVHGMVCSFCAKGIQKKLSKLKFVDTKRYKKGSKGSIKKQKIIIAIKPNTKTNIKAIYQAIRSGGYKPQAAYLLNDNNILIKFNAKGQQCASLSC